VLLLGLPLLGVYLAGKPVSRYLEFPPLTRYVEHAPFDWPAFIGLAVVIAALLVPVVSLITMAPPTGVTRPRPFPWWTYGGLGITMVAWALAWSRFQWFEALQSFTFTPLWVGYLLVINGWTVRRTGSCLLLRHPDYFLGLFLLSALFWWFFEYLNRFVQNWYYVGGDNFSAWEYAIHATLPFSTVLPAVMSTTEWLASFPRLNLAFRRLQPVRLSRPRALGWLGLLLAGAGLMGIGIWPDYLFPLLWMSPVLIVTSLQAVFDEETIFAGLARGDWRAICLPALAAVVCGFFWEMWNEGSLAHWEYTIPFVHRFQIFEMPILGYAGYFPFGLECLAIADFFRPIMTHQLEQPSSD
jgi:hypothetical protein